MPRSVNRPKIYDTVRNVWMVKDVFEESLFHSYVSGLNWNEWVRRAIVEYSHKCSIEPETPEIKKRAAEFPKFLEKTFKRQTKEKNAKAQTKS